MYLTAIFIPLFASILSGFLGRKVGADGAKLITTGSVIITTIVVVFTFLEVGFNSISVSIKLFSWISSETLNVLWAFSYDSLTVSMLIPVLTVSCLVHLYSIGYMSHDPHNQRFFSYLSLFTFMMITLVTANNFLVMFVGWEGVGICSYLLVNFWFTRIAANQSSVSALLTNRVGDCFLTIGMFIMIWSFGNLDYTTVFSLAPYINETIIILIGVCLLLGAMAKSSQIGLHVWLPMAMEGPTPVSALIHAATMVTAGVYLLIRNSPLIEYSSTVLLLCLLVGAITTIFSSIVGLFQQDIKKVIAYSTMSQLGMMVIAVGLSSHNIALFHLINHAFYKALLFLAAGSVIHAVADNQDFRKYGGLIKFLPLTYSVMLIASLSLVAFPFMTGFYSKDLILESTYGQFGFFSLLAYLLAVIGAIFTTLYSVKVLYLTFIANPAGPRVYYERAQENDMYMSIPLIILAIFSIFFGYLTKDLFIGLGSGFYGDNSIFIHVNHEIMLNTEFAVPTLIKLLPLLFTLSCFVLGIALSEFNNNLLVYFKLSNFGYNVFSFFNQRFYIELFYNRYIVEIILLLGGQTSRVLDKGSIELAGPHGLEKGLMSLSLLIARLDNGVITNYTSYILLGLVFYIFTFYLSLNSSLILSLISFFYIANHYIYSDKKVRLAPFLPFSVAPKPQPFNSLPLESTVGWALKFITCSFISFTLAVIPKQIVLQYGNVSTNMYLIYPSLIIIGGLSFMIIDLVRSCWKGHYIFSTKTCFIKFLLGCSIGCIVMLAVYFFRNNEIILTITTTSLGLSPWLYYYSHLPGIKQAKDIGRAIGDIIGDDNSGKAVAGADAGVGSSSENMPLKLNEKLKHAAFSSRDDAQPKRGQDRDLHHGSIRFTRAGTPDFPDPNNHPHTQGDDVPSRGWIANVWPWMNRHILNEAHHNPNLDRNANPDPSGNPYGTNPSPGTVDAVSHNFLHPLWVDIQFAYEEGMISAMRMREFNMCVADPNPDTEMIAFTRAESEIHKRRMTACLDKFSHYTPVQREFGRTELNQRLRNYIQHDEISQSIVRRVDNHRLFRRPTNR